MVRIHIVKDLGWLSVCQRQDYFTGLTVFKFLAGLQLNYIKYVFTLSRDIATRITRSCCENTLFLPKANKCSFTFSLQYTGATLRNNLSDIFIRLMLLIKH